MHRAPSKFLQLCGTPSQGETACSGFYRVTNMSKVDKHNVDLMVKPSSCDSAARSAEGKSMDQAHDILQMVSVRDVI